MRGKEGKVVHLREGSDAFWSDMRRRGGGRRNRRWESVAVVGRSSGNSLAAERERNLDWSGTGRVKSSRNGKSTAGRCTGRKGWRWGP